MCILGFIEGLHKHAQCIIAGARPRAAKPVKSPKTQVLDGTETTSEVMVDSGKLTLMNGNEVRVACGGLKAI